PGNGVESIEAERKLISIARPGSRATVFHKASATTILLSPIGLTRSMIHFVVHEEGDGVGVVVVEGVKAGQALSGWIMEDDKDLEVVARNDIPIGHKLALKDYREGDTVIKYGVDIGKVVKPIAKGEHLHVHNVKTKRW